MRRNFLLLFTFVLIASIVTAQDDLTNIVNENAPTGKEYAAATFKGLKIINAQTNETAKKHNLQFNIQHRFGDIATNDEINLHSFFGLDDAPDIRWSFEYGVSDALQLGFGRSKGLNPYTELYDGNVKFRLLRQTTDNKVPLSVTLYGVAGISGRESATDSTSDAYFKDNFAHRMSYVTQMIIARKFSSGFSFQLIPTWTHRNFVAFDEPNDIFSLGAGTRFKLGKRFALIADYFHNFDSYYSDSKDANGNRVFFDPLSVGIEVETGGHVFQVMFTNAAGILENSFLPFTTSNWGDGEFRWGFNITRNFVLGGKNW